MKKLLIISAVTVMAVSGFAQGLVTIAQSSFNITTNSSSIGGTSGTIKGVANSYYFALLQIADTTGSTTLPIINSLSSLNSGWVNTGIMGTNGTGLTVGKLSSIGGIPGATGTGLAGGGTTNFFVVVGWSATEGATWSTISSSITSGNWSDTSTAGVVGYTSVGYGVPSDIAPGFAVFGSGVGQIPTTAGSFVLTPVAPVPEPSTMVLAGLGGLSLLAFRRKK